jgi:hypothetical protein
VREPPDVDAALAAHRDALALATELGMRPLAARCQLGVAGARRRTNAVAEALSELSIATAALRDLEMTHWLDRAEARNRAPG